MFDKGWKLAPGLRKKNVSFIIVLFLVSVLKKCLDSRPTS